MKKLYNAMLAGLLVSVLTVASGMVLPQPVGAQATNQSCEVSADSGGFIINENEGTVTGGFVVSGEEACEPVEMSIAVWLCDSEDCLPIAEQTFSNATTNTYSRSGQRQLISTALPTTDEKCFMQVDLVTGGQLGQDGSAQYGDRRLIGAILPNPACKEVEVVTEIEEVVKEVEVPVEVVREVEVPAEPQPQPTPEELPQTGPSALLVAPALATTVFGGAHLAVRKFLRYIRGY